MHTTKHVTHLAPADQPESVHQIAERLLPAYRVDGGKTQLAGCTLDNRLFVRVESRRGAQLRTQYVTDTGTEVPRELVEALGMGYVAELEHPPQPPGPRIEQALDTAVRMVRERASADDPSEVLSTAAVWCKYAEGKLRFIIGEHTLDLPFAGWARTLGPPPLVCPHTGVSTYHLAATDDGRIVAAEQIGVCDETNRRVLAGELLTCSFTGRRAMPELFETCPVSGGRVLGNRMVACRTCRQRVSPAIVQRGVCAACRRLKPIGKADPRMARILHEHPPLDRWPSWRIAETSAAYVLAANGWVKRLLVVVDKGTLELKHLATGSRIAAGWRPVEPTQYDYVLRE